MRIGELSAAAAGSIRVLRHYEAQGLIQSRRSANNYREYPKGTVEVSAWRGSDLNDAKPTSASSTEWAGLVAVFLTGMLDCAQSRFPMEPS
jgi:hypothetical protein